MSLRAPGALTRLISSSLSLQISKRETTATCWGGGEDVSPGGLCFWSLGVPQDAAGDVYISCISTRVFSCSNALTLEETTLLIAAALAAAI